MGIWGNEVKYKNSLETPVTSARPRPKVPEAGVHAVLSPLAFSLPSGLLHSLGPLLSPIPLHRLLIRTSSSYPFASTAETAHPPRTFYSQGQWSLHPVTSKDLESPQPRPLLPFAIAPPAPASSPARAPRDSDTGATGPLPPPLPARVLTPCDLSPLLLPFPCLFFLVLNLGLRVVN